MWPSHTIIIKKNNNVFAFGNNKFGQLGLGDNENRNTPEKISKFKATDVACGWHHTMFIDLTNDVCACGNNEYGQLGLGNTLNRKIFTNLGRKAKSVFCGGNRTMMIDMKNYVWVCGSGYSMGAEQGTADPNYLYFKQTNMNVKSVACSDFNTMVILTPSSPLQSHVHMLYHKELMKRRKKGEFIGFGFKPEYQDLPHKEGNRIVSFYDKNGNIYLAEVGYDEANKEILPPK